MSDGRHRCDDSVTRTLNILAEVALKAVQLEARSGNILRDIEVVRVKDPQWVHQQNSYTSPTPVLDADRLFVHFGALASAAVADRALFLRIDKALYKVQQLSLQ
jgi:outer membrane protein assembly factor BamB